MATSSDWEFDVRRQVYINRLTGQVVDMNQSINTSGITLGPGSWSDALASRDPVRELYEEIIKLHSQMKEHEAMRTFLAAAYPDVLVQFDAAFAAAKRIGAEHGVSNTQKTP